MKKINEQLEDLSIRFQTNRVGVYYNQAHCGRHTRHQENNVFIIIYYEDDHITEIYFRLEHKIFKDLCLSKFDAEKT